MGSSDLGRRIICMKLAAGLLLMALLTFGQSVAVRGVVTDESGAAVPAANVTLTGPSELVKTTQSGDDGSFSFAGLQTGDYTLAAAAPSLATAQPVKASLRAGVLTVNLAMKVI